MGFGFDRLGHMGLCQATPCARYDLDLRLTRIEGVTERWRWLGWPLKGHSPMPLPGFAGKPVSSPRTHPNGLIICVSVAAALHMLVGSKSRETIYRGSVRAPAERAAEAQGCGG